MICSSKLKTLKKLALAVSFLTITASFAMEDSDEERRGSQQSLSTEERERLQIELNELARMPGMRRHMFRGRIQELRNILGIEERATERVDVTNNRRQENERQEEENMRRAIEESNRTYQEEQRTRENANNTNNIRPERTEERRGSQQSLSTEERERLQTELNELERMNGMRGARFRGRIQELRNILGIEERVDVTRQEALSQDKDSIKTNFSKLPKIINLIPDKIHAVNLLPRTLKEVEFSLMELLKDQSIKWDERFKLEKALRSLDTFYGNGNYLRFGSYTNNDYMDYSYTDMPNTMQLFITLIKLCGDKTYEQMFELVVQEKYGIQKSKIKEDSKNKFLESQLKKHKINPENLQNHLDPRGYAMLNAKNSNPSNFEQFKLALSEKFEENGIKLGWTLTDTTDRYHNFYKVLFKMMNDEHSPILIGIKKSLNAAVKNQLNPITEVLFMLARGHNTDLLKLESDDATDRTSCPDGVYLRLIKEIMLIVGDSDPESLAMLSKLEQEVRCERVN